MGIVDGIKGFFEVDPDEPDEVTSTQDVVVEYTRSEREELHETSRQNQLDLTQENGTCSECGQGKIEEHDLGFNREKERSETFSHEVGQWVFIAEHETTAETRGLTTPEKVYSCGYGKECDRHLNSVEREVLADHKRKEALREMNEETEAGADNSGKDAEKKFEDFHDKNLESSDEGISGDVDETPETKSEEELSM